jgi:hypothetical protein
LLDLVVGEEKGAGQLLTPESKPNAGGNESDTDDELHDAPFLTLDALAGAKALGMLTAASESPQLKLSMIKLVARCLTAPAGKGGGAKLRVLARQDRKAASKLIAFLKEKSGGKSPPKGGAKEGGREGAKEGAGGADAAVPVLTPFLYGRERASTPPKLMSYSSFARANKHPPKIRVVLNLCFRRYLVTGAFAEPNPHLRSELLASLGSLLSANSFSFLLAIFDVEGGGEGEEGDEARNVAVEQALAVFFELFDLLVMANSR